MASHNRYGPIQPLETSVIEFWTRIMCCSSTPTDEGEFFGQPGDTDETDDVTEKPSVIIPPSSLACVGFVNERGDVAQSYRKKFAKRMANMRRNKHGVKVAKATNNELITFEELLRKFRKHCNYTRSYTSLYSHANTTSSYTCLV